MSPDPAAGSSSQDLSAIAPLRSTSGPDRTGQRDHLDNLPACPVCGGHLIEIRQKRQCERCHTICETCCEGGRG